MLRDKLFHTLCGEIIITKRLHEPLAFCLPLTYTLSFSDAPSDYMPNGFKIDENPELSFENGPVNLKVGAIDTVSREVSTI